MKATCCVCKYVYRLLGSICLRRPEANSDTKRNRLSFGVCERREGCCCTTKSWWDTVMHVGTECVRDQEYRQYDNADFPHSQRHSKVCMIRSTSWHFGAFCTHLVEVTEWNQ